MWTEQELTNRAGDKIDHSFHPGSRENVLIILGHGLSGNKDRPLLVALATGLSALGWPCLRISYPGNGDSGGTFSESCPTREIADLQSVIDAVPHGVAVAYIGHSMGAAVGVLTAARDPRIQALVSLAGMTHTADFLEREFSELTPGEGFMWQDEDLPCSRVFAEDLKGIHDTLSAAEAVTQPWLLIHGSADELVPMQDGIDAFTSAGGEKAWLEIPGADHTFDETHYPTLISSIHSWLESSLPVL